MWCTRERRRRSPLRRLRPFVIPSGASTHLNFFFQAEDGIRAFHVTGVQTCALPISPRPRPSRLPASAPGVTRRPCGPPSPTCATPPRAATTCWCPCGRRCAGWRPSARSATPCARCSAATTLPTPCELNQPEIGQTTAARFPAKGAAMPDTLEFLLYLGAFLCFLLAAFSVAAAWASRINLIALGLAFWVFIPLVNAVRRIR